jgi:hypothetical protein
MRTLFYRLRFVPFAAILLFFILAPNVLAQPGACAGLTYPSCAFLDMACQPCNGRCIPERDLCILEPLPGGVDVIPASSTAGLGAFLLYVNSGVWQWAFAIGVALAVLNGTVGGFMIVLSNGDSGKIEAGKSRFFWSGMGLILLLLSGVILEFLNPIGFRNL